VKNAEHTIAKCTEASPCLAMHEVLVIPEEALHGFKLTGLTFTFLNIKGHIGMPSGACDPVSGVGTKFRILVQQNVLGTSPRGGRAEASHFH
jgi:hypothetical protein